jgi:pimeloyl-ACP methyl ester carboxylesterase
MIRGTLCGFPTADGETLHGFLIEPAAAPEPRPALLLVHGVALNFYTGPLPALGQALAAEGYPALLVNTRGHDWISRAGADLAGFGGATYERLEDCLLDLEAAVAWLRAQGHGRVVLIGHSLGAVKALYYQGERRDPAVVGVAALSCPRQYYTARAADQAGFAATLEQAEALLTAGRGRELLWAPTTGSMGLWSAETFVSKYGRHERNDVRPHAARAGCPVLALAGGAEHPYFPGYARELAAAAGPRGTFVVLDGADHRYSAHLGAVSAAVARWLAALGG